MKPVNMTTTGRKLGKVVTSYLYNQIVRTGVVLKGRTTREVEQQLRQAGHNKLATEMMRQLRIELNHCAG